MRNRKGRSMFDFRRPVCLPSALFVLLVMVAPAAGDTVVWRRDIRQAAEEAARENKPLLIKVTASWCGHCKRMQKTFDDRKIAERVNAGFIPLLIDADQYPEFVASIGVAALPATVILTPEMTVVEQITGYRTPRQLDEQLIKLCQADTEVATTETRTQTAFGNPGPAGQGVVDLEQAARQPTITQQVAAQQVVAQPPAFHGCCLVSLLDDKQLNRGLEAHTAVYRGATLAFASEEYKERFEADPERYWPAFDGYCAVSARDFQANREGMPSLTALYRGRTWFFARPDLRRRFISAPQVYSGWASR